jgi:hypothetical protein
MNGPVQSAPTPSQCRCQLADGSFVDRDGHAPAARRPRRGQVQRARRARAGRAHAQVVRLARHTERAIDSRDQVVISMDRAPAAQERDWELAGGAGRPRGARPAGAAPRSWRRTAGRTHWQRGRIDGHDWPRRRRRLLRRPGHLPIWARLTGQPDVAASVSSARAWFPLHSGGINDSLCWVEVSVYPLAEGEALEDVAIAGAGLDGAPAGRAPGAGRRAPFRRRGAGRWRTTVRFGQDGFHGNSYELALVLADRLARGREFVPRGRIIASGCSSAWHAGRVDTVEGLAPKCALIEREAQAGDRVLLPRAWEPELPDPASPTPARARARAWSAWSGSGSFGLVRLRRIGRAGGC